MDIGHIIIMVFLRYNVFLNLKFVTLTFFNHELLGDNAKRIIAKIIKIYIYIPIL